MKGIGFWVQFKAKMRARYESAEALQERMMNAFKSLCPTAQDFTILFRDWRDDFITVGFNLLPDSPREISCAFAALDEFVNTQGGGTVQVSFGLGEPPEMKSEMLSASSYKDLDTEGLIVHFADFLAIRVEVLERQLESSNRGLKAEKKRPPSRCSWSSLTAGS